MDPKLAAALANIHHMAAPEDTPSEVGAASRAAAAFIHENPSRDPGDPRYRATIERAMAGAPSGAMRASQLSAAVAEASGLSRADVTKTIMALTEVVAEAVRDGHKVTIPGFLSFEQVDRAARSGRNPQTGETIQIAASRGIKVSAGSKLKAAVKG